LKKEERDALIYARYQEGYSQAEIGKFYGLCQSRISAILLEKKRGIPPRSVETRGAKSRLSDQDLEQLREILNKPMEDESFPYWNKWSVKQIIKDTFDVDYHENYIWKLMEKMNFTSQRPQKKDYRQQSEIVERFKNKDAPAIKKSE